MRLIDARAFENKMWQAIATIEFAMKKLDAKDDVELNAYLQIYKAILEGIKNEPTIYPEPKWIPCSKRLPEKDKTVLVQTVTGTITDGERWDDSGWWFYGQGEYNATDDWIVAWKPLPEPYQTEECNGDSCPIRWNE